MLPLEGIMRKKIFLNCTLFSLLLTSGSFASDYEATPQEALMLRRISEYWKDGDYATVKKQIHDYLSKHENSHLRDHLFAMLGDIYFQEKNFNKALATYDLIQNPEIKKKIFFNSLQARFDSKDYLGVIAQTNDYLKNYELDDNDADIKIRRIFAEALFREALSTNDNDKKAHLLTLAKPHYKILSQTKYGDRALFPLAEIHRLLKEDERASDLYLLLAKKFPDHKERFLFQAAVLQINFNKEEALINFGKIYEMNGKRAQLAAFNKLILLYNESKFADYLIFYDQVSTTIPKEKAPLLEFYQGRCYYSLQNYDKAATTLESFVNNPLNRSKEYKIALLFLINCAKFQKDISLLERALYQLKSYFPNDPELPKAIVMHAQLCREKGDIALSLTDLQQVLNEYPNYSERESVYFDYALSYAKLNKWIESRDLFLTFLNEYPSSPKTKSAKRNLINCYIEILKDTTRADYRKEKEQFADLLITAYKKEDFLTDVEKDKYLLVLVKCLYELDKFDDAISFLEPYLIHHSDGALGAEGHLLMALSYQKMKNLDEFIIHSEKALSLNSQLNEKEILHLELYNAYLAISTSETDNDRKNVLLDLAAEHLYLSYSWQENNIKLDNQLWLANHYYNKIKRSLTIDPSQFEKSLTLFENLLGLSDQNFKINISSDSLYLENEVLKFADLIGMKNDTSRQITILEALAHKQQEHPELPWKLQKRTLLELANAYERIDQIEQAKKYYQLIINNSNDTPSLVTNTAQLHLAHLEYDHMAKEAKNVENADLVSILHMLKDLEIQKQIAGEPLHLEAALFYAEIRSEINSKEGAKSKLFFLKRMKNNFTSSDDHFSQEYQMHLQQHPDKERIYRNYMKYVQAEILKAEFELAKENNKSEEVYALKNEAIRLLDDLLKSPESLKPYLLDRVKKCRSQIISSSEHS